MQGKDVVTILCSGSSLGTYIPAMLIDYQLRSRSIAAELLVIDNYFTKDKMEKINVHKQLFHKSFTAALISQKLALASPRPPLDENLINGLLKSWQEEGRCKFIVFSGFWMHVIEAYLSQVGSDKISVDACYMDAEIPISWESTKIDTAYMNPVWFFSHSKKQLVHKIDIASKDPIPYKDRPGRLIAHGGGWGLGTYINKIPELESQGFLLDIVAYNMDETINIKEGNRVFMVDPSWSPWHKNIKGRHEFPPFAQIKQGSEIKYTSREEYHEMFELIRECKGIVSKPGGATLVDSIAAATPIIMLEPFGEHEKKNAQLWEHLGYGIPYDKWKEMNFSMDILEEAHSKILAGSKEVIDYGESYSAKNKF